MIIHYIIVVLIGYLLGCLNLAFFIGKAKGFDIRKYGSNNAGASNATITMGTKIGIMVGIHDIFKSYLAVLIASCLFPQLSGIKAIAGASAVLGHIFPFYLKFKGGKGFAPFLGMILALDWKFFIFIVIVVFIVTFISDYIVVGTFTYVSTKEAPRFIYGEEFVLFLFYLMFLIHLILLIPILQPLFAYYIYITFQCKKEV